MAAAVFAETRRRFEKRSSISTGGRGCTLARVTSWDGARVATSWMRIRPGSARGGANVTAS
jgi:hypothetical protein